jgi:tetratricopeptide (TPR) repeat protein
MAGSERSLQELIRRRQRAGFVGRQEQITKYRENLALHPDNELRHFIFNIHGNAGVGKTYLAKQLLQNAADNGALTAYIDERAVDAVSAMRDIAKQFADVGVLLNEFEERVKAYEQRRSELESDPQAPDGIAAFISKAALAFALTAARDVPAVGSLHAQVESATIADPTDRARIYLARKFNDRADVQLLLSPSDELATVFVAGLQRAAGNRPIALFFDTFERTAPMLDRWLRHLYDGRYGDLPATLVTTISGQSPLDPNLWGDYRLVIADIPLEPFDITEARQFLASKDIIDEAIVNEIIKLSERLPMWLATLADVRPQSVADIDDPADDAVGRFLKWEEDPDRRTLAIAASLPRTFNQDILKVVTPADTEFKAFSWLCSRSFIDQQGSSWKYHDVVRSPMLRLQRAQSPSEWRLNHLALAAAHDRWAAEAVSDASKPWSNQTWVSHRREMAYHLLCADPDNNLDQVLSSALAAAADGDAYARQWASLIADAARDTDDLALEQWAKRLNESISDSSLVTYFTHLIDAANLDNDSLALAWQKRGEGYLKLYRFDEALADLSRAVSVKPGHLTAIVRRATCLRMLERYDEALADLNYALELEPDGSVALRERGLVYFSKSRYLDALADFDRAIEIDARDEQAFIVRGIMYLELGSYDKALADCDRAMQLSPNNSGFISMRGLVRMEAKHTEDALADFERAVELDSNSANPLAFRGLANLMMGHYEEALADLNQATERDPANIMAMMVRSSGNLAIGRHREALTDLNRATELGARSPYLIANRGFIYLGLGSLDKALDDFNNIIDVAPDYVNALFGRGAVYSELGRYEEAFTDYNRALELRPGNPAILAGRGSLYGGMTRYEDALADFNRALELDPDNLMAIVSRADTYRDLGRTEDALADFDRALGFHPDAIDVIGARASVYRTMKRYDDAIIDLNHIIELSPEHIQAIVSRGLTFAAMERLRNALADFDRALELDPDNIEVIVNRGNAYAVVGHQNDALADFERALKLDPDNIEAIIGRGAARNATGRRDDAVADFNRVLRLDPDHVLALVGRGMTRCAMRRFSKALADFERALAIDSESVRVFAGRGAAYLSMYRFDEAFADFDRALELDPHSIMALTGRGAVYNATSRFEESLVDFDRALELDPERVSTILARGVAFMNMERMDDALAEFDRAVTVDPESGSAFNKRAQLNLILKRYEEARSDYQRAVELDPSYGENPADNFISLAVSYLQKNQADEAVGLFRSLADIFPDNPGVRNNYGFCLLPSDPAAALTEIERAEELGGKKPAVMLNRVLALHQVGRDSDALYAGNSGIDRAPPVRDPELLLWICRGDHSLALARIDYRKYLRLLVAHIRKRL